MTLKQYCALALGVGVLGAFMGIKKQSSICDKQKKLDLEYEKMLFFQLGNEWGQVRGYRVGKRLS